MTSRLRRSIVFTLAASALPAAPFVRAQSRTKLHHLVVADRMPERGRAFLRESLAQAGFIEGRNLRTEQVAIVGEPAELAESRAHAVIASQPDLIFTTFGPEVVLLKHLTREIPIVFSNCPWDPVHGGLIASAAQPGANVTGTYVDFVPLIAKRWALFREVLPTLERGAVLALAKDRQPPGWKNREAAAAYAKGFLGQERAASAAAERELGLRIVEIAVPGEPSEEALIAAVRRERPQALRLNVDTPEGGVFDRFLVSDRILSDLVVRVGYRPQEAWRHAIGMAARILRGERPESLPAYRAAEYTVKVNPTLARAMGITIPQSVMLQAGEIER